MKRPGVKIFHLSSAQPLPVMILGRTIDVITRHASHRARPAMWPGGRTPHRRRTEEDVMAQPRPLRVHVTGRTAAVVLLAAAPAGTPGIPSFDRVTHGGLPVLLPCPVACAAAKALLSVPTRQAAPAGCWGNDRPPQTSQRDEAMRGGCLRGPGSRALDQTAGQPRPDGKAEEEPIVGLSATTTTPPAGMRGHASPAVLLPGPLSPPAPEP